MFHGIFQERDKRSCETMTGLDVGEVHIQGVNIEKDFKKIWQKKVIG